MEEVLVVPRGDLEAQLPSGEVLPAQESLLAWIEEHYHFAPREEAEYDTSVKQIIPYVVIRQGAKYFLLRRLKKQTEARLHDRLSLGIGGHINPQDKGSYRSVLEAGLYRELQEEVSIAQVKSLDFVGMLHDQSGGVNAFHFALVYLLEAEGTVFVRETEKMAGTWASAPEIAEKFEALESWSQLVFRHILSETV